MNNTPNTANEFFDYDGAIGDLSAMYERGRQLFADSVKPNSTIGSEMRIAAYKHTLEIGYALADFFDLTTIQETL